MLTSEEYWPAAESTPTAIGVLSAASAIVPASQIVYGTDYPFDWPVGVDFVLKAPFLSDANRVAILSGNASRLLRIT